MTYRSGHKATKLYVETLAQTLIYSKTDLSHLLCVKLGYTIHIPAKWSYLTLLNHSTSVQGK